MNIENLASGYKKVYGAASGLRFFCSPGRVNLIGEHTDYNGGYVLPYAINRSIYAAAEAVNGMSSFFSSHFGGKGHWLRFPNAVLDEIALLTGNTGGIRMYIDSDLPEGGGLSSSAALEMIVAKALNALYELNIPNTELALACQRAEHKVGLMCGIMDQFTVAMGKKDMAILLNCERLEYSYVPLALEGYSFVVINSNVKHSLANSAYNDRRNECFDKTNPLHEKRMKHVNSENARVLEAAEALRNGNALRLGRLMNESHYSMRDDYEITCDEIDLLCHLACNFDACLGSRMTGGGFGGCTISLVKTGDVKEFSEIITKKYHETTGIKAEAYDLSAVDGTREIRVK